MTSLWSPRDRAPMQVRRNPGASLYHPVLDPDSWGQDVLLTPNGYQTLLGAPIDDAVATLHKAGTRGAVALGALVGLLVSSSYLKGALVGGALGYLGGKYVVGIADRTLAAISALSKVEEKLEEKT